MSTEDVSLRHLDLDLWSPTEQVAALYEGQLAAVAALGPALVTIAAVVDPAATRLRRGGRLVYAGAGASARIAGQDGAELLPTFNWPSTQIAFVIAGGEAALLRAIENAEDMGEQGRMRIDELKIGPDDVVLGLAASGTTPFTLAAVKTARARGALTIGIANNVATPLLEICDHPVLIETGEEAIAGSTRLKAATAQKIALNMISTAVMMRLGRVYRGMMVDMRPTNEKLRQRAAQMVMTIAGCAPAIAANALVLAKDDIKIAALIAHGLTLEAASQLVARHGGNLRAAMAELSAG